MQTQKRYIYLQLKDSKTSTETIFLHHHVHFLKILGFDFIHTPTFVFKEKLS